MTKNEIIRELVKSNPTNIKSLFIVYHNRITNDKYVYTYRSVICFTDESLRELARVLLSLYKLRKYVDRIQVTYFSSSSVSEYTRSYDVNFVYSVSDFIKTIKK